MRSSLEGRTPLCDENVSKGAGSWLCHVFSVILVSGGSSNGLFCLAGRNEKIDMHLPSKKMCYFESVSPLSQNIIPLPLVSARTYIRYSNHGDFVVMYSSRN